LDARRELRDALLAALERAAAGPAALAELPALVAAFAPKEDEDAFLERLDLAQALLRDAARAVVDEELVARSSTPTRPGACGPWGRAWDGGVSRCCSRPSSACAATCGST
jgi:hypothetical protein